MGLFILRLLIALIISAKVLKYYLSCHLLAQISGGSIDLVRIRLLIDDLQRQYRDTKLTTAFLVSVAHFFQ